MAQRDMAMFAIDAIAAAAAATTAAAAAAARTIASARRWGGRRWGRPRPRWVWNRRQRTRIGVALGGTSSG